MSKPLLQYRTVEDNDLWRAVRGRPVTGLVVVHEQGLRALYRRYYKMQRELERYKALAARRKVDLEYTEKTCNGLATTLRNRADMIEHLREVIKDQSAYYHDELHEARKRDHFVSFWMFAAGAALSGTLVWLVLI